MCEPSEAVGAVVLMVRALLICARDRWLMIDGRLLLLALSLHVARFPPCLPLHPSSSKPLPRTNRDSYRIAVRRVCVSGSHLRRYENLCRCQASQAAAAYD